MAIGSGLGGSLGVKVEGTYGTYVAPTSWTEFTKESLNRNQKSAVASGLAAGRLVDFGSRRYITTESGNGSIDTPFWDRGTAAAAGGMGKLLGAIFGGSVVPVINGATTAFTQTYDIADTFGKSLTLQAGIPDTTGTVRPYTFLGAKNTGMTLECGVDTAVTMSTDWDIRQVVETQTLAAPSYAAAAQPFHFGMATIGLSTAGTYVPFTATGGVTANNIAGVRKVSIKMDRKISDDRFYMGNTVAATSNAILKSEPITNDVVAVSGTIDFDYVDKTIFSDRFLSNTPFALTIAFTSTQLAGAAFPYQLVLQMSQCYVDGETPALDGPGVVAPSIPFVALADGTNSALRLVYTSSDSAV
jgi:hypothetical protein